MQAFLCSCKLYLEEVNEQDFFLKLNCTVAKTGAIMYNLLYTLIIFLKKIHINNVTTKH